MTLKPDILIIGAGIAGLWLHHLLRAQGYDCLLLEKNTIGGGQTIASQGILHSGLKYAFAGKINKLAQSISAMPDRWRACMRGEGAVDLSAVQVNANSQVMLIPAGFMGGLVKLVTKNVLGGDVYEIAEDDWPEEIKQSGFKGSVINMGEPVIDVPSLIRALAEPYKDSIKTYDEDLNIQPKLTIYTAAATNLEAAKQRGQDEGLQTQARPLVQGMLKPAPFDFYCHLVGNSDKPVATITTHYTSTGERVWYLGGGVAERPLDADPQDAIDFAKKGFAKYLPGLDFSQVEWATLPIDRVEGKSETDGWMPDTPTLHKTEHTIYCWPTKLTFAPLLGDKILEEVRTRGLEPSGQQGDYSALKDLDYAPAPWDTTNWFFDETPLRGKRSIIKGA